MYDSEKKLKSNKGMLSSMKGAHQLPEVGEEEIEEIKGYLSTIYDSVRRKFKDFNDFQKVIVRYGSYNADQLENGQKPEELVKKTIIEPLLEKLGFRGDTETKVKSPFGIRWPDYTITPVGNDDFHIYLEAEPMNTNLYLQNKGRGQVFQWLLSKAATTEYGIATDGIQWILVKFDGSSNQIKDIHKVDLRPVFSLFLNPKAPVTEKTVRDEIRNLLLLRRDNLRRLITGFLVNEEELKDEITQRFYNEYVRYVFGLDKDGKKTGEICLIDSVIPPRGAAVTRKELFSVLTMNRLFFITFLAEKGIIHQNLLSGLYKKYETASLPQTFYSTYLKPLFYEVFNKSPEKRRSFVNDDELYRAIPYLNGGLFRKAFDGEDDYDISNNSIKIIIDNLLNYNLLYDYKIGLSEEADLKPEILGYIFEKTINYISGTGTNKQKMEGAYYTPEDVVNFIVEETLVRKILDKMKEGLANAGWKETDLVGYNSIEDILEYMPNNPKHSVAMLNALDSIKVIDPACGSGHFLTTAVNVLTRIEASILLAIGKTPDLYELKRKVVSYNIFGVDMDDIGAEITKLRLWLSIISEMRDRRDNKTLPNIDFNIISGNTLIGQLKENVALPISSMGSEFLDQENIDQLANFASDRKDEIMQLLRSDRVSDLQKAYQILLSMYPWESGEKAVWARDFLEKINRQLYAALNASFYSYVAGSIDSPRKMKDVWKSLSTSKPLHWSFDFTSILESGGFDVIIGNPPYIEDKDYSENELSIIKGTRKTKSSSKIPLIYESKNCGNTYAYFIERSINLLKSDGRFGFIVPISLVSTDRMAPIREIIHNNSNEVEYYNFDDRPGKIFSGIEDCRSTIVITNKGEGVNEVLTSKYHRWYSEDRPKLFQELRTSVYELKDRSEMIPKLGTEIEEQILKKLDNESGGRTINDFIVKEGEKVWYHNAPRYWIHAHRDNNVPVVQYYDDFKLSSISKNVQLGKMNREEITKHYKSVSLDTDKANVVLALLNSSIFYWWFVIMADGRDLLEQHITSYPIDINKIEKVDKKRLSDLTSILMKSYDENSNSKINIRKGGYAIKIKEVIPRKSYETIKMIDDVLFNSFKLSSSEIDFIRNFDLKFRLGNDYSEQKHIDKADIN